MGNKIKLAIYLLSFSFMGPGCQHFRTAENVEDKGAAEGRGEARENLRYLLSSVGEVTTYEKETGIILVRKFGGLKPKESDVFVVSGTLGNSANIRFSGMSNSLFAAAELQSGSLAVGDIVYRRRLNPSFNADDLDRGKAEQEPILLDKPTIGLGSEGLGF